MDDLGWQMKASQMFGQHSAQQLESALQPGAGIGFDLVQISRIQHSMDVFGDLFRDRLFSAAELGYARRGSALEAERLAARFAAKEAVIKALKLSEAGVNWRDIEIIKQADGNCGVVLHGLAAEVAASRGAATFMLSLSHDGDYAGAFVMCLGQAQTPNLSGNNTDRSFCGAS